MRVKSLVFAGLALGLAALVAADDSVKHLTAAEFDDYVGDGRVHFLKFYAPWCGHCRRLAPTWADLSKAFEGSTRVSVASVDCTQEKDLCSKYEIRGFPTLKTFQGGEAKDQYSGARTLDALKGYIEKQAKTLLDETTA